MLPLQQVISIAVSPLEHTVKVRLRRCQILSRTRQQIGTCTGDTHPRNIIIEFIIAVHTLLIPGTLVTGNEVRVQILKHRSILLLTRCLIGIQNRLEHLSIAPPATVVDTVARILLLVMARLELVHHIIPHRLGEAVRLHAFIRLHRPFYQRRISRRNRQQRHTRTISNILNRRKRILPGRTNKNIVLTLSPLHRNQLPCTAGIGIRLGNLSHHSLIRSRRDTAQVKLRVHILQIESTVRPCLQHPALRVCIRFSPQKRILSGIQRRVLY